MAIDPRLPVLVGAGQLQRRPVDSVEGLASPAEMMAVAARAAAADSGAAHDLLARVDAVCVVESLSWRHRNPAAVLAGLVGATPRATVVTTTGGNSPQMLVNEAAGMIQRGELDVALVAGVEVMYSRMLARRTGGQLRWPDDGEVAAPTRVLGTDRAGSSNAEMARSLVLPIHVYPVLACAHRAESGDAVAEHQRKVAELWSRFSLVASENPNAWSREAYTPEQIATVGPDNRMIAYPYPKLMNANIQVDQAAAVILCSAGAAEAAGVPRDRWVFVHSGADAADHWFVSERASMGRSPAIASCGRAALGLSGLAIDDIAHLDLYSCFPVAVQIGALELGLDAWDASRPLTVTGGLGFAGGPGNNYVTHSIATMAGVLRRDPGTFGLVTALGWYVTKHAVGVYSTEPPAAGFRWASVQDEVDALPKVELVAEASGPATVEAYTVTYERTGEPDLAIVALRLPDGRRTWANSRDAAIVQAFVDGDLVGGPATVHEGELRLD